MNFNVGPTGVMGDVADLHQEFDRLSKSGDGLTGFPEGPNVLHPSFAVPRLLPNNACEKKVSHSLSVELATSKTFAVCRPLKG